MCNNKNFNLIDLYYMVRLFTILIIPLLFIYNRLYSQITYNSSGLSIVSNYGSVDYSIGEVLYTQKGYTYNANEGIQDGIIINPIYTNKKLHVSIYPIPTNDIVHFKVENLNFKTLSYSLITENGVEIQRGEIVNETSIISLKWFPSAVYIIKIYRNSIEETSFKILKVN
jgi:hypothetical protein